MPDLDFLVDQAEPVRFAQAPVLALTLRITNAIPEERIQSILLQCQVWIEPKYRTYDGHEQELLRDLFGEADRWDRTVHSLLWTRTSVLVPPFTGSQVVNMDVPCTYDFNVAAAKYFYALEGGEVPLRLMFSGTVFYATDDGALQVGQIPWEKEASFRLPVRTWRDMLDHYYPNSIWLCLPRDVFGRLYHYKIQHGLPTWEQTLERLLPVHVQEGES